MTGGQTMTGNAVIDTMTKGFDRLGCAVESLAGLWRPRRGPRAPAEMSDSQLLDAVFRVASDLIGRIGPLLKLSYGSGVYDDPRFLHPLPTTAAMHVRTMFTHAHDAFGVAVGGLGGWASAAGLGPIRNVAESLVITHWLLDDADGSSRQGRGYKLTDVALGLYSKHEKHLEDVAQGNERMRGIAARIDDAAKRMSTDFDILLAGEGLTKASLPSMPKLPPLFKRYLPDSSGYLLFALLSNAGAHPGALQASLFYGVPGTGAAVYDFAGLHVERAYWLVQAIVLYMDLCRLASPIVGLLGSKTILDSVSKQLEVLAPEVELRFLRPRQRGLSRPLS